MGLFDWLRKKKAKKDIVISAAQQPDQVNAAKHTEVTPEPETTKIVILSKGKNTLRKYSGCDVYEDQVFEAVIAAGAKITGIGLTEVHDWDDRDWYSAGFKSYEAYLQDTEHDKYLCEWSVDAEYGGISITFTKPYNMVRDGLYFSYAGAEEAHLAEFFETFDSHCCKNKTVMDRRDPTQKQASAHSTPKQKQVIEPKAVSHTTVAHHAHRGNTAEYNIQTKAFTLHTAKDDAELNLIQSELSALIEREYGKKIFPYMYDEDLVGHFGSFDPDTVHYFFSLYGFELQLNYYLRSNCIMLLCKGSANDSFGSELADFLKEHIHEVLTQKDVSHKNTVTESANGERNPPSV